MNDKERYIGIIDHYDESIETSYDDIPLGTPVFAGRQGGGVVNIPIKKEEEIKFRDKIEKLENGIKYQDELLSELYPKLKRKYKKKYKWLMIDG